HHSIFYSFNATAPSVIYTLSLHDALPICFQLLIIARQTYPTSSRMFSRRRPCPFEDHTSHRRSSPIHSYPDDTFQSPSRPHLELDRKSTRLNSSHVSISYAVFCLKKKNN